MQCRQLSIIWGNGGGKVTDNPEPKEVKTWHKMDLM
jgi:hypothetical protein